MDIFSTRLRVNKRLLSFVGLWPNQLSSNKNTIFCCTILGILIICLPQITYLYKHGKTLDDFYNTLPTLAGAFLCLTKSLGFRYTIKKFTMLVRHVNYDWCLLTNHEDMRILIEYIKRSRMFTLAYSIFVSVGAASYVTAPLTVPIFDFILASNVTRPKKLPHPSEFFIIDIEKYYYILFAITSVGYVMCCMAVCAIDTVYFALLQYSCGMLTILSHRLENLSNDQSNLVSKGDQHVLNTIQCVQLHIRIERLIQLINSTFAICLFTDIGFGILFQCSSCVMIVTRMDIMEIMRNGPLLLVQTSRIFFNSWIGQTIIDHSSELSTAAYNGMWYQSSSLKAKKMLPFLIAKCRKPYHIILAKLYVISLESYSTLMRTSVSYVMLMLSLSPNDA